MPFDRLLTLPRFSKNLSVPLAFSKHLSHPEKGFSTVHVAGTNGKGSVSGKIAKACALSGLKTGLFTSPHLFRFEERIQIQDAPISRSRAKEGLLKLFQIADREGFVPTFFEMATFLAFDYFREVKVDIAIIEVGMGGRLDATNVITPLLSIITSISREHVEYLGDTLEEIGAEKAGILKPHVPVVLGPKANVSTIRKTAERLKCPVHEIGGSFPFYDEENQAIARKALALLNIPLQGLEFRPRCRFEEKGGMIFDVAHNPDGFMRLQQALDSYFPDKKYRFVIGMSPTKEIGESLKQISKKAVGFHFVQSKNRLTAPVSDFKSYMQNAFFENSVIEGIKNAQAALGQNEIIVVCGSFYIMEESYYTF
jgi:dihydrofolate synthase/folylpolyglutamate synthase